MQLGLAAKHAPETHLEWRDMDGTLWTSPSMLHSLAVYGNVIDDVRPRWNWGSRASMRW